MFYVFGLGNPGNEYENSRHNTGRMAAMRVAKDLGMENFRFDKKANALVAEVKIKKEKVSIILPETFMNKSGSAVGRFVKPLAAAKKKKGIENLVVIYDDIDLPLGILKISFNKGSGGHKGLESVVKAVRTPAFTRIRIGVSPANAKGIVKKPHGEKAVLDFILGSFKPGEKEILNKVMKRASEAIETLIVEGRDKAMNLFN
jgi:PTH1 family peptidyl-tRNA hydrolase